MQKNTYIFSQFNGVFPLDLTKRVTGKLIVSDVNCKSIKNSKNSASLIL